MNKKFQNKETRDKDARDIMKNILLLGSLVSLVLLLLGSGAFYALSGAPGAVGFATGSLIAWLFVGLSALSIMLAVFLSETIGGLRKPSSAADTGAFAGNSPGTFFAVIMGTWLLKMLLLLVVIAVLRNQDGVDRGAFLAGLAVITGAGLVVDMVIIARSRISPNTLGSRLRTERHRSELEEARKKPVSDQPE